MGVTAKETTLIHTRMPLDVLDADDFNKRVVMGYEDGTAEKGLEADLNLARSLIPAGTGFLRDFSYIAPEIPYYISENCTGCMDCVTECPDTAILGKAIPKSVIDAELAKITDPAERERQARNWAKTTKYWNTYEKKKEEPAYFGIFIDPTKCKGCAECVTVCDDLALKMVSKTSDNMPKYTKDWDFFRTTPATPKKYVNTKILADMMLTDPALLYVGGAGSCAGCGEATAIRMMLAATGFVYGQENIGMVASTGCNTVYTSTYPYNPYMIPWTNSLFENGPADAMGVRLRWDQMGWQKKRLWLLGGDGAMNDIGFQSLSRMLAKGSDIKVLVLDTQVYSNTGGQASTSSYMGQDSDFARHGKTQTGKSERRKELATLCIAHPDVYVAQTTCAHVNHFYKAIMEANEYPGPAVINVFTTCQPEHGVADHMAGHQAKLAADTRAFPILIHDPRKGEKISERLSLLGNPAMKDDWYKDPKTGEVYDFIHFARSEGRFSKQFDKEGNPSAVLKRAQEDRLKNWHMLQELAGLR
jgi:pyruvate/2-oxoacid:ferredoxin oxidoreductase beta subunit/NAD-dependent dihydropyrimidine dehydrogenase PreA subunit